MEVEQELVEMDLHTAQLFGATAVTSSAVAGVTLVSGPAPATTASFFDNLDGSGMRSPQYLVHQDTGTVIMAAGGAPEVVGDSGGVHRSADDGGLSFTFASASGDTMDSNTEKAVANIPGVRLQPARQLKYNWDVSVNADVLPVRCKKTNGFLHKNRLGSGARGTCIESTGNWYTPIEFENMSGRSGSRDWKRSIRFGGRPLMHLLEDGFIMPHAICCLCTICSDGNINGIGPVRVFTPFRRKKNISKHKIQAPGKLAESSEMAAAKPAQLQANTATVTQPENGSSSTADGKVPEHKDAVSSAAVSPAPSSFNSLRVSSCPQQQAVSGGGRSYSCPQQQETVRVGGQTRQADDQQKTPHGMHNADDASHVTLESLVSTIQQMGEQLQEKCNVFVQQLQEEKKKLLEQQEEEMQQLRTNLEKDLSEAVNEVHIQTQLNVSRIVAEKKKEKEVGVQHVSHTARHLSTASNAKRCANCNRLARFSCSRCQSVFYCGDTCRDRDWPVHYHFSCQQQQQQEVIEGEQMETAAPPQ